MGGTRGFFLLLAVLVVCFVVGVGAGAFQGGGAGGELTPGWLEGLGGFVSKQPLGAPDVGATVPSGCREALLGGVLGLPRGTTCTFVIKPATGRLPGVRVVTLTQGQGGPTLAVLEQGGLRVEEAVVAGQEALTLDIFKDGGTLAITCPASTGGCQVFVE